MAFVTQRRLILTAMILVASLSSHASQERRVLVNQVYKEIPITVKLNADKENAFRDLSNFNWVDDFQLEVTNTGTKPIYFLLFSLVPDLGDPEGARRLALTVKYGRNQLSFPDEPAIESDIPILPNEKAVLTVNAMDAKGWYHFIKVENWPEEKSKPKKTTLYFEMLNYGDGTGFSGGDVKPYSVPKREYPRPAH